MVKYINDNEAQQSVAQAIKSSTSNDRIFDAVHDTLSAYNFIGSIAALELAALFNIQNEAVLYMLDSGSGSSGWITFWNELCHHH